MFDLYHDTCIPPAPVPSDAATCSSPHCCRKQLTKPSRNCRDLYCLEFPFSRSVCRVHGNPSQTPDSPLFKVQQLQKLGLRVISGAVWFEKQGLKREGASELEGRALTPGFSRRSGDGEGFLSLRFQPGLEARSAELSSEGQQRTRVPAGSLRPVTVTVLPAPRAQPRAARLGAGLERWLCDQYRLCARSYKSIWASGSASWAAQCSASLLSYRLTSSFRTYVNPPASASGRMHAVYSCTWWLRPAARPVRREVPVHEGLGDKAAGLPSVGIGKEGELL